MSLIFSFVFFGNSQITNNETSITLQIDGSKIYQQIDGFGVNINASWWNDGDYQNTDILKPAIDLLLDSLGASYFRVVIEEMDWEEVNDDNDPNTFNWNYYNEIFSNNRFKGIWNTLQYLNSKGVSDRLILSFMGAPPSAAPLAEKREQKSWMGGTDHSIALNMEDEFVESIAALLYYARHVAKIQFRLVSPLNETDILTITRNAAKPDGIVEGPNIPEAVQYTRIIKKLALKLDRIGMDDIRFMAPDSGGEDLFVKCMNEMTKDPYLISKLAYWAVHQYCFNAANYNRIINESESPNKKYIITETAGIENLFGQLDDNAQGYIYWDGFDCIYQHAIRNGYGSVAPNDWIFGWGEKGKPLIEYLHSTDGWKPRKQFYEFAQVLKFIRPGAVRIDAVSDNDLTTYAFLNQNNQLIIVGHNKSSTPIALSGVMSNLPEVESFELFYTDNSNNLKKASDIISTDGKFNTTTPGNTVFTLSEIKINSITENKLKVKPEPAGWYTGDMHVHRDCGGPEEDVLPEEMFVDMMKTHDLDIISVLADMGNIEVKFSKSDLLKVNGEAAPQSIPGRIVHWDAEWHWDPFGTTFEHKAVGGHIVLLGMTEVRQIWDESTYRILEYGRQQDAIVGFCHLQYLNDSIQSELNCCIPIEHVSEIALGMVDFIAEDVYSTTMESYGSYNADATINAYYKFLNCGFRLGLTAGTDYPCNNFEPFGSLLTYVKVDGPLTYRKWVEGIRDGKTVIARNGHHEFLNLRVEDKYLPGDEIMLNGNDTIEVEVEWTAIDSLSGNLELVFNGKIIASQLMNSSPGKPATLKTKLPVSQSGWICARRMGDNGHQSHTSAVYITVNENPVRASVEDAIFFVDWIDNLIEKTSPGGPWNQYYENDLEFAQNRYKKAKEIYLNIAKEAAFVNIDK